MSCCWVHIILWWDHERRLAKSGFPKFPDAKQLSQPLAYIISIICSVFTLPYSTYTPFIYTSLNVAIVSRLAVDDFDLNNSRFVFFELDANVTWDYYLSSSPLGATSPGRSPFSSVDSCIPTALHSAESWGVGKSQLSGRPFILRLALCSVSHHTLLFPRGSRDLNAGPGVRGGGG